MGKILPFPWYGGKYTHTSFVYEHLPQTEYYAEPFCGSAVILLNKPQSSVETINDLNSEIVNFFEVLQTDTDELLHRIEYTPYSREIFEKAKHEEYDDEIERALYFLVRTTQSYNATGSSWAKATTVSRRGKSQKVALWEHRKQYIEETATRLSDVQIENSDAAYICEKYDDAETTFYCDPPYPPDCRKSTDAYEHEMGADAHREFAETARSLDGYVAISSYESPLLNELYEDWNIIYGDEKTLAGKGTGDRTEVLYTNYDPNSVTTVKDVQQS